MKTVAFNHRTLLMQSAFHHVQSGFLTWTLQNVSCAANTKTTLAVYPRFEPTFAPIWFPHCPAWICTISRILKYSQKSAPKESCEISSCRYQEHAFFWSRPLVKRESSTFEWDAEGTVLFHSMRIFLEICSMA